MFKPYHITCVLWITIGLLAISLPAQSSPVDENEIKKGKECKTFCGSCGCIGFYCGEECICECNEEKNDDTECIASIQAKAKESKIPFEILIQGPSGNRFLRNALQFDQNQQQCSKDDGRKKRSTVVIYKPAVESVLDPNGFCEKPMEKEEQLSAKELFRGKRAIKGDSWFTDFSNTLVKPAPLPGKSTRSDDTEDDTTTYDTESDEDLLPKIRGRIRNALSMGENGGLVKGIRKTVKKMENKSMKTSELDDAAKKFRGAISTLRNRAEEIILPSAEMTDSDSTKETGHGRRFLSKLRGKILRSFVGEDGIVS